MTNDDEGSTDSPSTSQVQSRARVFSDKEARDIRARPAPGVGRLGINKLVMNLGYGVTMTTNSFAAMLPLWVMDPEVLTQMPLPDGVEPPLCFVKDDHGMMYPSWLDPEVISKFLDGMATNSGSW